MYCRKCGDEIPDDSKFCPYCGESSLKEILYAKGDDKKDINRNTLNVCKVAIGIIIFILILSSIFALYMKKRNTFSNVVIEIETYSKDYAAKAAFKSNGFPIYEIRYDEHLGSAISYEYNDYYDCIKVDDSNGNISREEVYDYKYDNSNKLISADVYANRVADKPYKKINYEFDKKGYLISKKCFSNIFQYSTESNIIEMYPNDDSYYLVDEYEFIYKDEKLHQLTHRHLNADPNDISSYSYLKHIYTTNRDGYVFPSGQQLCRSLLAQDYSAITRDNKNWESPSDFEFEFDNDSHGNVIGIKEKYNGEVVGNYICDNEYNEDNQLISQNYWYKAINRDTYKYSSKCNYYYYEEESDIIKPNCESWLSTIKEDIYKNYDNFDKSMDEKGNIYYPESAKPQD